MRIKRQNRLLAAVVVCFAVCFLSSESSAANRGVHDWTIRMPGEHHGSGSFRGSVWGIEHKMIFDKYGNVMFSKELSIRIGPIGSIDTPFTAPKIVLIITALSDCFIFSAAVVYVRQQRKQVGIANADPANGISDT